MSTKRVSVSGPEWIGKCHKHHETAYLGPSGVIYERRKLAWERHVREDDCGKLSSLFESRKSRFLVISDVEISPIILI